MIRVLAKSKGSAEILIYDPIGADWFGNGVTAKRFRDDLAALGDVSEIVVRFNSPGGEVFDGFAIYNALREHKARKVGIVDGLAASIASVILMACDEVRMGVGAQIMIHDPWTIALGDADAMRHTAEMLDTVKVGLVDAYESKTGLKRAEIEEMMNVETWLTADAAIEKGFADSRVEDLRAANEPNARARFHALIAACTKTAPQGPAANPTAPAAHRGKETMTPEEIAAAQAAEKKVRDEAAAAAVAAEVARRNAVVALFANHEGHDELREQCAADPTVDEAEASKRLLKALATATPTARVSIPKGGDNRDKFIAGVSNAVLARAGSEKLVAGNEYAGSGLLQIVSFCLERKGVQNAHRLNRSQLATQILASQSSSDFPLLLADIATKLLRKAYEQAPTTWRAWCGTLDVPDFKTVKNLQTGTFNSLATIGELGEYTYGSIGEDGESITAATKGKGIIMSRQMLINDDLGAFNRMASLLGAAAARTVNEDVYDFLHANAATRDTGALFNNTAVTTAGGHANLGTSAAITVGSLAEAEKLMALQKDVGLRTSLNLSPRFLLAPRGKRQIAWEVLNSTSDPAQSNPAKRNYATQLGLELVSDARLDNNSATAWYIACDPSVASLVDVAFLDGVQTPYTDEHVDWDTDAMKLKVRLDYGVGPGDWRAGVKNAGA